VALLEFEPRLNCSFMAIQLQFHGYIVTLIDRNQPGREPLFGNAGVLCESSATPRNHPALWQMMPLIGFESSYQG
ncbi:MAG: hypothetical protein AAF418_05505, partial [Pseudomonadota bacterium]